SDREGCGGFRCSKIRWAAPVCLLPAMGEEPPPLRQSRFLRHDPCSDLLQETAGSDAAGSGEEEGARESAPGDREDTARTRVHRLLTIRLPIGTWNTRAIGALLAVVVALPAPRNPRSSADLQSEAATPLPRPDHTVVVILENHSYTDIIGNATAPYLNSLRSQRANFLDSHAIPHPSEPNYLALFEGDTENLSDDSCPHVYSAPNLASGLFASGQSFAGYSESMPVNGYTGCNSGNYARRRNPWVNYINVPATASLTFDSLPDYPGALPTVSYMVPDLCHDMHDCSVATGDAWLQARLDPYVQWARTHNSLFIVTFDEDEGTTTNRILTLFVGPMVEPGDYATRIDHYSVLRTLEEIYGVPATGKAASAEPIAGVWKTALPRAPILRVPRPSRPTPDGRERR